MATEVKIIDSKIARELPMQAQASNLLVERDFTFRLRADSTINVAASGNQQADASQGYYDILEELKTQVDALVAPTINASNDFIIDVLINSCTFNNTSTDNSKFQTGTVNVTFGVTIRVTRVASLDAATIAQNQNQILYWGYQADTTPPTTAPSNASLGIFGGLDVANGLTGSAQNLVIAIPNQLSNIRILIEGTTNNFSDYTRTPNAFMVGSVSYDVYVKGTAIDNTFTTTNLLLVP